MRGADINLINYTFVHFKFTYVGALLKFMYKYCVYNNNHN